MSDVTNAQVEEINPAAQYDLVRPESAADSTGDVTIAHDTYADKDYDVINSYNFVLRVEAFQNIPLKAVRGINKQNEYEYIQEGGLNDYVHMVRKPISQPFTFQVERYVSQDWLQDAIDPLANGTELILPLILYIYRSNNRDGSIPARYYVFTNCRVTGVQVGDLDAEKSGLHTITNTIAYSQMIIVTLPFAGLTTDDEIYRFNDNNAENKINTSHVRTLKDMGITRADAPEKEKDETDADYAIRSAKLNYRGNRTVDEMSTLARKYQFLANESGNTQNLETTKTQAKSLSKSEMLDKAIKYDYSLDDKEENTTNTTQVKTVSNTYPRAESGTPQEGETLEASTKKSAESNYRGNRTKLEMESLAIKGSTESQDDTKTPLPKTSPRKYRYKKNNKPNNTPTNNVTRNKIPDAPKEAMEAKAKKYSVRRDRNGSAVKDELEMNKTAMEAMAKQYNMESHYVSQENAQAEIRNEYKYGDGPTENVVSQKNEVAKARNEYKYGDGPTENVVSQENSAAEIRNQYKFGDGPTKNVVTQKNTKAEVRKYPPKRSARQVSEFLKGR